MKPRVIHNMTWRTVMESTRSEHAQYCVRCNGMPYAVYASGIYPTKYTSLRGLDRECRIGCIKQPSDLPMVVWYPEGNWLT